MTLDDLTSGFNIGIYYFLSYGFNEMVVFFKKEICEMLTYYSQQSDFWNLQFNSSQIPICPTKGRWGFL